MPHTPPSGMATGQHVSPKHGAVPMRSRQSESLGQPQPELHHTHTQAPRTLSCIKYTFDSHFCLPTVEQVGPTLRQGTGPRRAETRAPGGNGCPKSRFRASRKPERRRLGTNSTRGPECWHRPPGPHLIPPPPPPATSFHDRGLLLSSFTLLNLQVLLLLDPSQKASCVLRSPVP